MENSIKFTSIEAFVPSGSDFEGSKNLFLELGFTINWENDDLIGFQKDACKFILQRFNDKHFAENFMLSVKVIDLDGFYKEIVEKDLVKKYGVRVGKITQQPYARELNMIDIAGVCWHFGEG